MAQKECNGQKNYKFSNMKGGKKGARNLQPDVPIVYDPCGIDVNDPVGNHLVNFTFEVTANDDSEKPFEGDIDFVLPYNLPKNTKTPKIELSHPTTEWKTTMPTLIDDNFLNLQLKILFQIRPTIELIDFLSSKNHIALSFHHIVPAQQYASQHSNTHM